MDIHIQNIHKDFGSFKALDGVDLDIQSSELIALLGPSGSGKTTLLRVIAGLEFADAGAIRFGGEDMARVPVRERQVGFVFQHYALFKHMTVLENVGFGLSVRKDRPSKDAIRQRALELLDLVQLSGLEKRYPAQLSGGQRQRVALARALAIDPKVLLLDEPFGALDAKVRKDLRRWLRELHDRTGVTTVFVTHDQEEALELADRVVIMNKGRIEQVGHVDTVYEQPANPFVFDFLGGTNVLPVEIAQQAVRLPGGAEPVAETESPLTGEALLYVRPGDIRLAAEPVTGLPARVTRVHRTGPLVRIDARVVVTGTPLSIELPHLHHDTAAFRPDAEVRLRLLQFSVYPRDSVVAPDHRPPDAIGVAASRKRSRA
jgi:sulfate transport system ATP-binding protein